MLWLAARANVTLLVTLCWPQQYKVMWKRAQRRLLQAVHAKYPSFVKLFRAFDENKNGVVTFDEFSTRLKTLNDPTHYNPKEARVLFHSGESRAACRVCVCLCLVSVPVSSPLTQRKAAIVAAPPQC